MAKDKSDSALYTTGLTEDEAKEVNKYVTMSFFIFVAIAVVAHLLVWTWRPWLGPKQGYGLLEAGQQLAQVFLG